MQTVLSKLPLATRCRSGKTRPIRHVRYAPGTRLRSAAPYRHPRCGPSRRSPLTTRLPSWENETDQTVSLWPLSFAAAASWLHPRSGPSRRSSRSPRARRSGKTRPTRHYNGALERLLELPRGCIPDPDRVVVAPARHALAVRGKRDRPDSIAVTLDL